MRTASHLTYARANAPLMERVLIRSVEELSGRRRLLRLYDLWRRHVGEGAQDAFGEMLRLMRIDLTCQGELPNPQDLPKRLVMIANHPFGIGDGAALLALAERLDRPFRILINNDLMKIPEMARFGLPVSFEETREATARNLKTRQEALTLLSEGVTIVIFPAGGVATAPRVFGPAADLPWKQFTARLIRSAEAAVLPVYFHGQNGALFHAVSKWSMVLRVALLIGEFRRLYGRTIAATIGPLIAFESLRETSDRRALTERLRRAVEELGSNMAPAQRPACRRGLLRRISPRSHQRARVRGLDPTSELQRHYPLQPRP